MILQTYTIIHTLLSLIAIFTGLIVVFGMLAGNRLNGWTKWFLFTAVATTITGFFFPFHGFYAGHRSRNHIAPFSRAGYFRALSQTPRGSMAVDLRDRCGDLSLF